MLPMAKRDYVTSMGAWYGFFPRCDFPKYHKKRDDLLKAIRDGGLIVRDSTNKIISHLPVFALKEFFPIPMPKIEGYPYYPQAERYEQSVVGFPPFTFHEYDLIDKYVEIIARFFA